MSYRLQRGLYLLQAAVWTLTVSEADAHPLADAKPEAEAIAEANRCGSCNSGNNYGTSSSGYSTGGYNDDCPFSCGGAGVFTKILEGLQIIIVSVTSQQGSNNSVTLHEQHINLLV
ncbi:hypothetical protein J6590_068190 [Homalodisca vitripennis]|nr:hypothetical protein J6590_068190 [Homalodisca vitripennis]